MRPKVVNIKNALDVNSNMIGFCKRNIEKNNKKTINFLREIIDRKTYEYKEYTCPYGYTTIVFANQIIPSVVTQKNNLNKIVSRERYYLKQKNINYQESIQVYYDDYKESYLAYLSAFILYDKNSRLLHDLINSISFFLDIKLESSIYFDNDTLQGFQKLNEIIKKIRNLKYNDLTNCKCQYKKGSYSIKLIIA